ncbi:GNAT family N-acetyltransferase [Novosphingobium cyanobacteriorum]|uniref:GNAT family N-acetyltransferase n=1 Tax=Novosphingobium cyanobacteriorum TaxID=3024215 RepID=A0ABT6CG91_9SPHN|nr:GNAT family N-acetyltransferase [Novosphingobium cyanobacteriorum]MDF8332946.1 GNAT family N-acetyltransferase [Novosphingobium cyanobacteriorum]
MTFRLETARLALRDWRDGDVEPFHAMGRDPRVMAFLGPLQSRAEVEAGIQRQHALSVELGHCFWALERLADGAFLGFCGLKPGPEGTPLHGRIEIGWRLAHHAWGHGYAREAAQAALDWGFAQLASDAIWAMTVPGNVRSRGLMERLGMRHLPGLDFDHPALPADSPLLRHVVYAAARPKY